MRVIDIADTQGYTPLVLFEECWFGVKEIDDDEYKYSAVIIDNEGDIIRMKLQYTELMSDDWFTFADKYRIPKASKQP